MKLKYGSVPDQKPVYRNIQINKIEGGELFIYAEDELLHFENVKMKLVGGGFVYLHSGICYDVESDIHGYTMANRVIMTAGNLQVQRSE